VRAATTKDPDSQESIEVEERANLVIYSSLDQRYVFWVTVVHGTSGYHIMWLGTGPEDRSLFEEVLATFSFAE
jgi:hypothetical protein